MDKNEIRMTRPQALAEDIVIVDGMSRSGKSIIAPIISSLDRGELWVLNPIHEYLCVIDNLKRIERDGAVSIIKLLADMDLYHSIIGRHVNFRETDESSAHSNLLSERYLKRLKSAEGDCVITQIQHDRPILPLLTHYIFGASEVLFDAFGSKMKLFIVTVRHPLWLIEAWYQLRLDDRMGKNPRDFQICCEANGNIVPWFCGEYADEYHGLNPLENAIRAIKILMDGEKKRYKRLNAVEREKVLFLPFERFVVDPMPYMGTIMQKLETKETALTEKVMQKMRIPRELDKDYLDERKNSFDNLKKKEKLSSNYCAMVDKICREYEEKYLSD